MIGRLLSSVKAVSYSPIWEGYLLLVASRVCVFQDMDGIMVHVIYAIRNSRRSYYSLRYDLRAREAKDGHFFLIYYERREKEAALISVRFSEAGFCTGTIFRRIFRVFSKTYRRFVSRYICTCVAYGLTSGLAISIVGSFKGTSGRIKDVLRDFLGVYGRLFLVGYGFQGVSRGQVITFRFANGSANDNRPSNVATRSLGSYGKFFVVVGEDISHGLAGDKYCVFNDASRSQYVIYRSGIVISHLESSGRASLTICDLDVTKGLTCYVRKVVSASMRRMTSVMLLGFLGRLQVSDIYRIFQGFMATKAGVESQYYLSRFGFAIRFWEFRVRRVLIRRAFSSISRSVGYSGSVLAIRYFMGGPVGTNVGGYD